MASLALDPMLVAKINALLASSFSQEPGSGFADEDIVELFEAFLSEQILVTPSAVQPSTSSGKVQKPSR